MKDKPDIKYHDNGNIKYEFYYKEGKLHRDRDKPAKIRYYVNGNIDMECYYKEGKLHRDGDNPAVIWYDENGNVEVKCYYKNDNIYKINEYKKGSVDWNHIYNYSNYDFEFLVNNAKEVSPYMSREEKLKVIEYKMIKV